MKPTDVVVKIKSTRQKREEKRMEEKDYLKSLPQTF